MFGFGKKKETVSPPAPAPVPVPDGTKSLDQIIESLSDNEQYFLIPSSDDIQSLLVQLGSDFKITNRNPATDTSGTNIDRSILLCAALLLRKMK